MLTVNTETVFGQLLIPDSCICYTDNQDKRANECLINRPKDKKLINNLELEKRQLKFQIVVYKHQKKINEDNIQDLSVTLTKTKKRLNTSISLNKYGIPLSLGAGFIIGIIIAK